ncbi:MAG: hypothetical protein ACLQDV_22970 [Candidatus Binataceae bacterium]
MDPRRRPWGVARAVALMVAVSMPSAALAAGAKPLTPQQALEMRLDLLEKQNQTLEIQNRTIQSQLSGQAAEIDALKQQLQSTVQPVANLQHEVPQLKQQFAVIEEKQYDLPFEVGFRTGWAESPYDMPGGFFYSAYLNHRLLTPEDGIPGGFVSGELSAGVILGNHASSGGNLYSELGHPPASTWLDTIEIQPTVQYHLEPEVLGYRSLAAVKPYVLAGPGMWINLLSTPIVVTGKQPASGYRHYDADFQGGGVFGFGTEVSLSAVRAPAIQRILDKSSLGAEWRYNQFANGQAFQQYSGSIGFGW